MQTASFALLERLQRPNKDAAELVQGVFALLVGKMPVLEAARGRASV